MPETVGPPPVRVVERRRSSCGSPRAADQYGELQPRADRHRAARWVAPHGRYPRAPRRARSSPACASRRTRVGVPVATRTRGSRPGDGRPRGGPRPDRPGARAGPHPQYRAEYPADAVVVGVGLPPRDEPAPVTVPALPWSWSATCARARRSAQPFGVRGRPAVRWLPRSAAPGRPSRGPPASVLQAGHGLRTRPVRWCSATGGRRSTGIRLERPLSKAPRPAMVLITHPTVWPAAAK